PSRRRERPRRKSPIRPACTLSDRGEQTAGRGFFDMERVSGRGEGIRAGPEEGPVVMVTRGGKVVKAASGGGGAGVARIAGLKAGAVGGTVFTPSVSLFGEVVASGITP